MNKVDIYEEASLEGFYLNLKIDSSKNLDYTVAKVVQKECADFLLPFKVVEVNGELIVKYTNISQAIALEYYIDTAMNESDFVKLYLNILSPLIEGKDWFLDYHNFYLDLQHIYVDRTNGSIKYIYVPDMRYKNSDEDIFAYLKSVLGKVNINGDERILVKLFQYFERGRVTLNDIYNIISQEAGNKNSATAAQQSITARQTLPPAPASNPAPSFTPAPAPNPAPAPVPAPAPNHKQTLTNKEKDKNEDDDIMNALFGTPAKNKDNSPKKGGIFEKMFGSKNDKSEKKEKNDKKEKNEKTKGAKKTKDMNIQTAPEQTANAGYSSGYAQPQQEFTVPAYSPLYPSMADSEETVVAGDVSGTGGAFLQLEYSAIQGAPERINLNFNNSDHLLIGRISNDAIKPDIAFPREFTHIGRKHARLEQRSDGYYLIDLGSANHTLINDDIMIPNKPYKLEEGEIISFSSNNPIKYRVRI